MEDDDYYGSDDGFDALPANTLAQLEKDALQSTQHQRARTALPQRAGQSRGKQPHHDDAGSFEVIDRQQPPAEYGLEDEEILDLDEFPRDVRQELSQWPQRPAQVHDRAPIAPLPRQSDADGDHPMISADLPDLQQRILELESENSNLHNALTEAQSVAQSKTGEASLLRQRVDKDAREYEHKLHVMRQMHNEADARQKAEVMALKRDREKMATDNQFLAHDLVLEAGRNRQVTRPAPRANGHDSPGTTPKKHKVLPYRDGFDDDDIMLLSPSRARSVSKTSTPRAVGKRKREPAPQSPVRPLVLQPVEPSPKSKEESAVEAKARLDLQRRIDDENTRSRLMRRLVDHQSQYTQTDVQLVDTLSEFSIPAPDDRAAQHRRNFASIFVDRAAKSSSGVGMEDSAAHICDVFVSLLDECLQASYHDPVDVLIETISLIAHNQGLPFAKTLINKTVPLLIAACDLVAFPIARAAIKSNSVPGETTKPPPTPDIDVLQGLSLLQTIARACAFDVEAARSFWRLPSFEFMMVMLMKAQPLDQILAMLQLLSTSVLPDSFGVISSSASTRSGSREADTINRLSLLLSEKFTPPVPDGLQATANNDDDDQSLRDAEADFDREDTMLQIRLEVASIFLALCTTDHGTALIATHRHALGRLIRFLHTSVTALYSFSDATHDLHVAAINTTMRVIHYVMTSQAAAPGGSSIDVREKLRPIPGGTHMWLLCLTRLAFLEGIVAEEGIASETSDMAHQLLDEYLSPDEGEMLLQVFSTGVSTE